MFLCGDYSYVFVIDVINGSGNHGFCVFGATPCVFAFGHKENWTSIILSCSERGS